MIDLEGKTVLITGASRGIGRHLALTFAKEKANLSLLCRKNIDMLKEVAEEACLLGASVITSQTDVTKVSEVEKAFEKTLNEFGRLDVLINNAGTGGPCLIHELDERSWDESIDVNLKSVFLCSKAAIRPMIKQGGGQIISISSIAAVRGIFGGSSYTASKIAIIPLMQTIAKEYGKKNIRANSVLPGFHITDMTKDLPQESIDRSIADNALGRTTTLDEASAFISFLAMTENISGQVFNLDSRIKREI